MQPASGVTQMRGACHCGAVTFTVRLSDGLTAPRRCNCSFCRMRGAVVVAAPLDGMKITAGEDFLTLYQFNTRTAKHWFCKRCGIYTHHQRRSDPSQLGINVACLEGVSPFDFASVPVFEGRRHPSDTGGKSTFAGVLRYQPVFDIRTDDLSGEPVRALLALHLSGMHASSPAGHVFALDLSGLQTPDITVWSVWDGDQLAGIGALKLLGDGTGEIKSMRTAPGHLRRGVAAALLSHIIAQARQRGLHRLSLETGSGEAFEPALTLYRSRGFANGGAFGDYVASDFNQFLHLDLD